MTGTEAAVFEDVEEVGLVRREEELERFELIVTAVGPVALTGAVMVGVLYPPVLPPAPPPETERGGVPPVEVIDGEAGSADCGNSGS